MTNRHDKAKQHCKTKNPTTMYESGYYPMGAEHDPSAPWNQHDPEPMAQEIEYTCLMRRTATVETSDYIPGSASREWDGDGYVTVHDDPDFSDTDWLEQFKRQYRTPEQLIALLAETARQLAAGETPQKRPAFWREVIKDCQQWQQEEEDTDYA